MAKRKLTRERLDAMRVESKALLAGQSPEQLPAESVLELSHSLGNSALLELMGARQTPPGEEARPLPAGPCATAPAEWSGGAPALTEAPAFAGMAPMGAAAPLAL